MSEIILSEEQLEELASRIAEKIVNITKQNEDKKIRRTLDQTIWERSFRVT